jgi:hypothetical protein
LANYRGCRNAKEELQRKKSQKSPKTTMGMVFSYTFTTPSVSFEPALRGRTEDQQRLPARQVAVAAPGAEEPSVSVPLTQESQQPIDQKVPASNVNSLPLDNMIRVITAVQQIMTEFNGAVSEEAKVVAITKIVLSYEAKWPLEFIGPSKS